MKKECPDRQQVRARTHERSLRVFLPAEGSITSKIDICVDYQQAVCPLLELIQQIVGKRFLIAG